MAERPSRWSWPVKPGEGRVVAWSFTACFLLFSGLYLLRPVREAWGVASGWDKLPWMFWGTFLTTLVVIPIYSRVVARAPKRRIVPIALHGVAATLLLFYAALRLDVPHEAAGKAFFVWYSVINLFVVAVFWSLMADLFRSEQGRRLFGLIAAGASLGAIAGPTLVSQAAERLGLANLLLISVAALELCVPCIHAVLRAWPQSSAPGAGGRGVERIGGSVWAGFTAVLRQRYLAGISLQLFFTTTAATFLYMLQAKIVSDAASGLEQRMVLFANIDVFTNLLSLLLQFAITGPVLLAWGPGPPIRVVAALLGAGLLLLATWPVYRVMVIVQSLRRAGHYALERPAINLLFTVVGLEEKYKAKGFIDTVVYRGGDALAASAFNALWAGGLGVAGLSLATVPLAAGGFWLAGVLARRHRGLEAATQAPLESAGALREGAALERKP